MIPAHPNRRRGAFLALALALGLAGAARADEPAGRIRFQARNSIVTADGEFRRWRIRSAEIDEATPARSAVEVEVDLASIDTANAKRDDHLRTADYFDVATYPVAVARLTGFRPAGENAWTADVDLDLHGTKRRFPMTFRVVDRAARRIAGDVVLKRTDFGIGAPKNTLNPMSIDEDVPVRVEAVVPTAAVAAPAAP